MSFDEEPDAPLHGECAAEINKLQAKNEQMQARILEMEAIINSLMKQLGEKVAEFVDELRYINEVACGDCELMDVQDDTEAMAYINEHISEFLDKALASTNSNWLAEHDAEVRRKVLEEVAKYFYVGNPRVCEEIRRMAEQGEPK